MKKQWVKPRMDIQLFTPNQYVATCLMLYCRLAGSAYETYFEDEVVYNCAMGADCPWGDGTHRRTHQSQCYSGSLYNPLYAQEVDRSEAAVTDVVVDGKQVTQATDLNLEAGVQYEATWVSHLYDHGMEYHHKGYAVTAGNHS